MVGLFLASSSRVMLCHTGIMRFSLSVSSPATSPEYPSGPGLFRVKEVRGEDDDAELGVHQPLINLVQQVVAQLDAILVVPHMMPER